MAIFNSSPAIRFETNGGPLDVYIYVGEDGRSGGIKETFWSDKGMEVSIDFIVPWRDRLKFLYLLRGSCGFDGTDYWRYPPIHLPSIDSDTLGGVNSDEGSNDYQWNRYYCSSIGECRPNKIYVTSANMEETGQEGWPYYDEVIIPTKWSVPLYRIGDGQIDPATPGSDPSGYPYTTTRWHIAGEIFSPYTNAYRFSSETTPANEANIGIMRVRKELSITRHFMPIVDTVSLDPLYGKINSDTIKIGTDTSPAESMMYLGYESEPYVNPSNGRLVYDITHRIMVNGEVKDKDGEAQRSWNYYMNRQGYWDKLVLKDNPDIGVYTTSEFACKIWPEYVKCKEWEFDG